MLPEVRGQTLLLLVMILYSTSHTDALYHLFAQQSMLYLLRFIRSLIGACDQYPFRLYSINLYNAHCFFFYNSPRKWIRWWCFWGRPAEQEGECEWNGGCEKNASSPKYKTSFRATNTSQGLCWVMLVICEWCYSTRQHIFCALKASHVNKLCCQQTQDAIACTVVYCFKNHSISTRLTNELERLLQDLQLWWSARKLLTPWLTCFPVKRWLAVSWRNRRARSKFCCGADPTPQYGSAVSDRWRDDGERSAMDQRQHLMKETQTAGDNRKQKEGEREKTQEERTSMWKRTLSLLRL